MKIINQSKLSPTYIDKTAQKTYLASSIASMYPVIEALFGLFSAMSKNMLTACTNIPRA